MVLRIIPLLFLYNNKIEGIKMNILILNGSLHPRGNTIALVDTFNGEAQKAGHQTSFFRLGIKIFVAVKIIIAVTPH